MRSQPQHAILRLDDVKPPGISLKNLDGRRQSRLHERIKVKRPIHRVGKAIKCLQFSGFLFGLNLTFLQSLGHPIHRPCQAAQFVCPLYQQTGIQFPFTDLLGGLHDGENGPAEAYGEKNCENDTDTKKNHCDLET
jgi:hypothetical protein